METEFAYYERRITEETIRALMANCDKARDAHLGLLRLYRQRLECERRKAAEKYQQRCHDNELAGAFRAEKLAG